ncbi:MAG: hypothetical protein DRP62_04965 [Planctomycetota bacterium]|nr:MAG: hypothetical protein DRP62_04965 [Planctomycetota bacterium]
MSGQRQCVLDNLAYILSIIRAFVKPVPAIFRGIFAGAGKTRSCFNRPACGGLGSVILYSQNTGGILTYYATKSSVLLYFL